jgi:hypothetical protein
MSKGNDVNISLTSTLLCLAGALIASFGMSEEFGKSNFMPPQLQFKYYTWLMIIIGYLLMFPRVISIIKNARATGKGP